MSPSTFEPVSPQPTPRRTGRAKKLLIGAAVLIVLLIAAVAVLVPVLAGSIIAPRVEAAASSNISGSVKIDSLSVSWTGSQKARDVRLLDPDGTVVARADLTVHRSLFALITSPSNLGTVSMSGWVEIDRSRQDAPTNLERAITPRRPAPQQPEPRRKPLSLPSLAMTLDLTDLRLSYTVAGERIGVADLSITGPLAFDGQTDLTVTGTPTLGDNAPPGHAIAGSFRSGPIINSSRELTPTGSGFQLNLNADLPAAYATVLTSLIGGPPSTPPATPPPAADADAPVRVQVALRENAGRIVSAGSQGALTVTGPVPPSLIANLAPPGSLAIHSRAGFSLRTTSFDLPAVALTHGIRTTDLRATALVLAVNTDPVDATITTTSGARTTLRVEPVDLRFGAEDLARQAFAHGDIRALVGGTPAGTALLDIRIDNLLTPAGNLAPMQQVRPRGELQLVDAPASVLDPIAARIDALGPGFVRDVFGDALTMTLTAGARADLGSEDSVIESPRIGLDISSPRTTARATAILDSDRIDAPGEAFTLTSSAGRPLLQRFAPQLLEAMQPGDLPVTLTATMHDLRAIQGATRLVDWDRLNGSLRVTIDRQAPDARGVDRITLGADAARGAPTALVAVATGRGPHAPYSINADLALRNLSNLLTADDPLRAGVLADGTITIDQAPLPVVEQLAGLDPGTLANALGDRADGRITLASSDRANTAVVALITPAAQFDAGLRLDASTLTSDRPARLLSREPRLLVDRLDAARLVVGDREILRITGARAFEATIEDIRLDLDRLNSPGSIAAGIGRIGVRAPGLELVSDTGDRLVYDAFTIDITSQDGTLHADISATTDNRRAISASARLPLQSLLDGEDPFVIIAEAQSTLSASITAPPWLASALAGEQAGTVSAALGETPLTLTIEPDAGASLMTITTGDTTLRTTARITPDAIFTTATTGAITLEPAQVRAVLASLATEGEEPLPYSVASPTTVRITAEPFTIPLGTGAPLDTAGLTVTADIPQRAVITGVIEREGTPRDLGITGATARISFSADGPNIDAAATPFDPARPADPLGALRAQIEPGGRFDLRLVDARPRALDDWLEGATTTDGPFALTFGDSLQLRALTSTPRGLPAGTDRIEISVQSPRLSSQLLAERSDDRIALAEPFQVAWTLAPAMFDVLVDPLLADTEGSDLRLREPARAAISVRSFSLDKRNGSFDPATMRIDADFGMINANFDAILGPATTTRPVALGKLQGSITRNPADDQPTRFELVSLSDDLSQTHFTIEGSVDTTGETPSLTANAQGDIPTALIDVLAGQQGLAVAAAGDTLRIQARADAVHADRSQGRLTASLQTGRVEATAFGRFDNGALVLADGAASSTNITLSEITPELSRRLFEPLFPLLRAFEKSRDDAPTMITVTRAGLAIPTDGDISKLNGNINLNLGSVRFEANELLATVLSATSNRTAGRLGQSVPPVLIRFNSGVASYDQLDIPFGDISIRTRGTINLVDQSMDIIVLLPLESLSGDIQRAAERFPLVRQVAAVPFRARGPFDTAKLELDPSALQDILPGAIEQNLENLINQGLRDLFRR